MQFVLFLMRVLVHCKLSICFIIFLMHILEISYLKPYIITDFVPSGSRKFWLPDP